MGPTDEEAARTRATDMAARAEAGTSLKQIGVEYGVSRQRVSQILSAYGFTAYLEKNKERIVERRKKIDAAVTEALTSADKVTHEEVAAKLGMPMSSVQKSAMRTGAKTNFWPESHALDKEVYEARQRRMPWRAIGEVYGLCLQWHSNCTSSPEAVRRARRHATRTGLPWPIIWD
jgi:hypothetical protein